MKKYLTLIFSASLFSAADAQQMLEDFEAIDHLNFGYTTGMIDTAYSNPFVSAGNASDPCARYIRSNTMYDFITMYPPDKFSDVSLYASSSASAKKIRLKIYTGAAVGTPITLQLGSKLDNSYPGGIHSEYTTTTAMQNAWHTVTFNYFQAGGFTSSASVDKMILLFNPGQSTTDTILIDDINGPEILTVSGIAENEMVPFRLYPNSPNPVKTNTKISFTLNSGGNVSLKLYDMLGNPVRSLVEPQYMKQGSYSIPLNTDEIHNGIYFYVLKKDGVERSMKLIVSK